LQGKVIFSCGHEDKYRPTSGWRVMTKDYDTFDDGSFGKCITYSNLCLDCYIKCIGTYPEQVIFDSWEEDEWLNSEELLVG
jgi:hypothetical protein